MSDDDRLSDREKLAECILADADGPMNYHAGQRLAVSVLNYLAAAGWVPPERVREAERRGAVEALRDRARYLRQYSPAEVYTDTDGDRSIRLLGVPDWLDQEADRLDREGDA